MTHDLVSRAFIEACRKAGACDEGLAWCEKNIGKSFSELRKERFWWVAWALRHPRLPAAVVSSLVAALPKASHRRSVLLYCRIRPSSRRAILDQMTTADVSEVANLRPGAWRGTRAAIRDAMDELARRKRDGKAKGEVINT